MSTKVFVCLLGVAYICGVQSHSWIACSDYTEKNGADWDPAKCRGYPRDAAKYAQKNSFGQDRGFDYKPAPQSPGCKSSYNSGSGYSSEYPKAIYYPGQQVVIVHPMKNHGADDCTNPYIPDFGNKVYRGKEGTDRDQTFSYYKAIEVADLGISPFGGSYRAGYPKTGYQNAPHFCQNTDRAMGTYSFNIPVNTQPGEYTFMWRWSFNGPQDVYTTCFDVVIASSFNERNNMLLARGQNDFYVACGGTTSNGGAGSSTGCNGVTPAPTQPPQTPKVTQPPQTQPPQTAAPVTPKVTVAPTQGPDGSVAKPMNVMQMTGEVSIGFPRNGVTKRYVMVHFDCVVQASFWNARLTRADNGHYELLQENPDHVRSGKVYFTANFEGACPVSFVPHAKLLRDE